MHVQAAQIAQTVELSLIKQVLANPLVLMDILQILTKFVKVVFLTVRYVLVLQHAQSVTHLT